MKIARLFVAAGLAVAALGVGTAAQARDWNQNGRPDRYDRAERWQHNRGYYGHDRRWNRHHRVRCHTEWRHHHRIRVCR